MAKEQQRCPTCGIMFKRLNAHLAQSEACRRNANNVYRNFAVPASIAVPAGSVDDRCLPIQNAPDSARTRSQHHRKRSASPSMATTSKSQRTLRSDRLTTLNTQEPEADGVASENSDVSFGIAFGGDSEESSIAVNVTRLSGAPDTITGIPGGDSTSPALAQVGNLFSGTLNDTTTIRAMGLDFKLAVGKITPFSIERQTELTIGSHTVPSDRVLGNIYNMCDKAGAARYLGDQIINYLRDEVLKNRFSFQQLPLKRDPLMKRLQKATDFKSLQTFPITLESGFETIVYRFDIPDMIQRHLLSRTFADTGKINPSVPNPFSAQVANVDFRDLCNGRWYVDAAAKYRHLLQTEEYILHPWVLYGDKTGVDQVERNSLEPIAITSANLTREAREDDANWILLGYVPNLKAMHKGKSASTAGTCRSTSLRDYHSCLRILLEPFLKLQQERPNFLFRHGGKIGRFKIIAPLMAVIGDNLSNDNLAQRVFDNSDTSPRLSRRCLCLPRESDHPVHRCHPIPSTFIKRLSLGALGVSYGQPEGKKKRRNKKSTPPPLQSVIPGSQNYDAWKAYLDGHTTKAGRQAALNVRMRRSQICDTILHKVLGSHALMNHPALFGISKEFLHF